MPAFWHPHGFGRISEPKPDDLKIRSVGGAFDPSMLDNMTNRAVPCEVVKRNGKFTPVPVDQLTASDKAWLAAQSGERPAPPNGNYPLKKAS